MVKGIKFIITVAAIIISVSLSALCAVPSEVISVPAAGVLNNGDINVSLYNSMSLSPASDPIPFSYNLGATYGLLGIANVSLHMYTYKDYAGQVQFSLMKDEDSKPALDIGIKNITYRRYIDEGGGSDSISAGLIDNAYPNRSSDMLSAYIVATKDFGRAGRYTLGIGRGEFVGYDYGRFLSSVVLFEDYAVAGNMANEFMFGLFGGFEIPLVFNTSLKADFDGRDVNAGLCYNFKQVAVNAALTHIELFRSDNADLNPRVELGLAYTFSPFGTPKVEEEMGHAVFNIMYEDNKQLTDGMIEFIIPPLEPLFVPDGNIRVELPPGTYRVKARADMCEDITKNITVKPGKNTVEFFEMSQPVDIEEKAKLTGRIIDKTTDRIVIPSIEIEGYENADIQVNEVKGIYTVELPPGEYTLTAVKDGYIDWYQPIILEEGEKRVQNINMLKKGGSMTLRGVNFMSGSSDITPESYPILDEAVALLKSNRDVKIEIQGYTDSRGSVSSNLTLSQNRADRVKEYLVQNGIDPKRITTRGFGETKNIADNETPEHRALNRRIEFSIIE